MTNNRKLSSAAHLACASGLWLAFSAGSAAAAVVDVQVVGAGGSPVAEAVVYAAPIGVRVQPSSPKGAVIDQIRKEFVPRINVIQAGAAVSFPNKDNIRHHVYSFSPAKSFELKLYHGMPSQPVVFDKAGTVTLGCNIHDGMIAYVLVVETPYFAKTDASGRAHLEGLPAGEYEIKAWQPQSGGGSAEATLRARTAQEGVPSTLKMVLRPAAA